MGAVPIELRKDMPEEITETQNASVRQDLYIKRIEGPKCEMRSKNNRISEWVEYRNTVNRFMAKITKITQMHSNAQACLNQAFRYYRGRFEMYKLQ